MNISQLKHAAAQQHDLRIHVVQSRASKLYQIECEAAAGQVIALEERGRPQLFRSLEAVYDMLKQVGVHQAWLVRWEQRHLGQQASAEQPVNKALMAVAL